MRNICVGNQKGGVGKSTIADNLAVIAANEGRRTLLIDADPQGSSMAFRGLRQKDDIKAMSITTPTLHKDLRGFADAFDYCFIDAGGRDSSVFRSAIMACDILLIPTLPSQYDIYALLDTLEILKEARVYKEIPAFLVLNQMLHAKVSSDAQEALQEIAGKHEIALLHTTLYSRVAFKNSVGEGQGVTEYEPNGKAALEMKTLYNELLRKEVL